ncbi:MAG: hypothetical protein AB7G24_00890 [Novosphingobium sp.]
MIERRFTAVAMPQGDPALGTRAPGVLLVIHEAGQTTDFFTLSRSEAAALAHALGSAERALVAGENYDRENRA